MPTLKIDELNQLYTDGKSADKESYAEMRSNILLSAGEHYSKRNGSSWNRVRSNVETSNDTQKLRITKNWIHKYLRLYVNHILSKTQGATVAPQNPTNIQDQKTAELNKKVNDYLKHRNKTRSVLRYSADDYCRIGEVCLRMYFDPMKGYLKGYEGKVSETGEPVLDEMGQPVPDESKPVMTGEIVWERIFGHQIFRDTSAKSMAGSTFIGIERLEPLKKLKEKYKGDNEKQKYLVESKEDFIIFDSERMGYSREKDQVCLREFYFRPSHEYPDGYFYLTTQAGILEEGPLPFGIFPIKWAGFDEHPTKCRATSFIKVARPWQSEINRASSQTALHQVTLGDDKVLYQSGTKVSPGALLPGVRGLTYQGAPPTILPGRDGSQYQGYVDRQVIEMGAALLIDEIDREKQSNLDPYTLLYRSMKEQSYFSFYQEKFSEFWIDATFTALELARKYMSDEELIEAIGTDEIANISEFRNSSPLCYKIVVEEGDESLESRLGRQMTVTQILQYVGQQLSREDIGKIVKNLPFGNWKDDFEDLTMNETNVQNDFLALERGEFPHISPKDDSNFVLQKVASRMKKRDFQMLSPEVQELYSKYEQIHLQKQADEAAKAAALDEERVPTGGAMVACDMYVPSDDVNKAPKRVRMPYEALDWLIKTLDAQGSSAEKLEQMNQHQLSQVANMLMAQRGGQPDLQTQMQ
jgi:hypothetical protein